MAEETYSIKVMRGDKELRTIEATYGMLVLVTGEHDKTEKVVIGQLAKEKHPSFKDTINLWGKAAAVLMSLHHSEKWHEFLGVFLDEFAAKYVRTYAVLPSQASPAFGDDRQITRKEWDRFRDAPMPIPFIMIPPPRDSYFNSQSN